MKNIFIKKSYDFSEKSHIYVYINDKKNCLSDYQLSKFNLSENDTIYVRQMWVTSKKLSYKYFDDDSKYMIKPLLGKISGFIFLIIFTFSIILFFVTHELWLSIPILLVAIYIIITITIFSNRYLKFSKIEQ